MALTPGTNFVAYKKAPIAFAMNRGALVPYPGATDFQPGQAIGSLRDSEPELIEGAAYYRLLFLAFFLYVRVADRNIEWATQDDYPKLLIERDLEVSLSRVPQLPKPTITPTTTAEGNADFRLTFDSGWIVLWSDFRLMGIAEILSSYQAGGQNPGLAGSGTATLTLISTKSLLTTTNILLAVLGAGLLGTLLYLAIKNRRQRQRPY